MRSIYEVSTWYLEYILSCALHEKHHSTTTQLLIKGQVTILVHCTPQWDLAMDEVSSCCLKYLSCYAPDKCGMDGALLPFWQGVSLCNYLAKPLGIKNKGIFWKKEKLKLQGPNKNMKTCLEGLPLYSSYYFVYTKIIPENKQIPCYAWICNKKISWNKTKKKTCTSRTKKIIHLISIVMLFPSKVHYYAIFEI